MTIQTLIRLHAHVIKEFGLRTSNGFGVVSDKNALEVKHIWNEDVGGVEVVDEEVWEKETLVGSPAGVTDNKIRFFFLLAFTTNFDFTEKTVNLFMGSLIKVATEFNVDLEDCESFFEYMLVTVLLPMNVAPADFIETVLYECDRKRKKPLFQKDYLVTNVKKPTQEHILAFLKQLPLDKDMPMD